MDELPKKSRKRRWILLISLFLAVVSGYCGYEAILHLKKASEKHIVVRCQANLKINGVLCYQYALEHNGSFPHSPDYIKKNSGYMKCLKDPEEKGDSYFLIPGLNRENSSGMPLMIEKIGNHREESEVIVLHAGGHVMRYIRTVQTYPDLLPMFSGITPEEKAYLRNIFAEWEKGNFSFIPESPFKIKLKKTKEQR